MIDSKSKYLSLTGDSLWKIEYFYSEFSFQTGAWLEGVGDGHTGLYNDYLGIESSEITHSTRDGNGMIHLYEEAGVLMFDVRFLHGVDQDGDGAFNYTGRRHVLDVYCDTIQRVFVRECDTLCVISQCTLPLYYSYGFGIDEEIAFSGDTVWINNLTEYSVIYIHHQYDFENFLFAVIEIYPCLNEDCDDANAETYPCAVEIPNNDVDEDCDGEDLVISNQSEVSDEFRFEVFPNPTSNIVNYYIDGLQEYGIVVYDVFGNEIACAMSDDSIDFSHVAVGLYFIGLIDEESGKKETRRLVIQR